MFLVWAAHFPSECVGRSLNTEPSEYLQLRNTERLRFESIAAGTAVLLINIMGGNLCTAPG